MKTWMNPEIAELDISKTEKRWTGIYRDGGYIGDGEVSGHLQWKPNDDGEVGEDPSETAS